MTRPFLILACLGACLALPAQAQQAGLDVLKEYASHGTAERLNTPEDEIDWLKKNQFTHGELDNFPQAAIVLHRVDIEPYLDALGFKGFYTSFAYGFTDPSLVYVVRKPGLAPFAVARGLPGAGGVTTLAAELHAMGASTIIHVGTAGLLSPDVPYGQIIVADGSSKDGAAFLLDGNAGEQIVRPDAKLTERIVAVIAHDKLPYARAIGFTIPIYYFQPGTLLRDLLAVHGTERPSFIEMEEASFFAIARLMGIRAASIVVASDRLVDQGGKLTQGFWDGDLDELERTAFQEAIRALANP
jgi:purine-nucleoside phosphorylase